MGVRTVEEPPYSVLAELGDGIEIRRYGPRIAAETTGRGPNDAFRTLAGYIFGGNRQRLEIAMTAPVTMTASQRIAMTAPVATAPAGDGLVMRFFMPAGWTMATLPEPSDPRVSLVEVPAEDLAVLRYTGLGLDGVVAARSSQLLDRLATSDWQPTGAPVAWFYDPPWTIPFLRRNEIAVAVKRRTG
jgi:hypothetical protein